MKPIIPSPTALDKWENAFIVYLKHNLRADINYLREIWAERCNIEPDCRGIDRDIAETLMHIALRFGLIDMEKFLDKMNPESYAYKPYGEYFIHQESEQYWQRVMAIFAGILLHTEVKYLIGYNHEQDIEALLNS